MPDDWRQSDYIGYNDVTSGGYVQAVQRMLVQSGFGYSAVDGYYGSKTQSGISDFQKARGISSDGIVGPQAWGEFQNSEYMLEVVGQCNYIIITTIFNVPMQDMKEMLVTDGQLILPQIIVDISRKLIMALKEGR
ncbi:Putative peptidoglycan binding domain-containing protein [Evansella caseinilytica]|uniref:Putative peptidoglycan binding domain-containing protein n=1 Tax=Evansella caseinilytica TaxID=1503961 RepID=A0A1H3TW25_9BACI|nr:peptidoglycan-binding domain-containing protein [Evansella caseinilytica]SDZ53905.1 Putative peptidoglycan binding domain-containing protein [Evansella caseinilytica]